MGSYQGAKNNKEISIKELLLHIQGWRRYIVSKWKIILILFVIGGIAGFFYARSKETLYRAESTFVLDEGKSGGAAISGLALLGINTGGASAGLFTSSQNIIWLYKSKLMLHETLMSPVYYRSKFRLLIDIFLDENGLRAAINESSALKGKTFKAGMPRDSMDQQQSSILLSCIKLLKGTKYLSVSETSNAENLITVEFKSKDEVFSKLFVEVLVNKVNQFYVKTKTEKIKQEIGVLEQKADSTRYMLNSNMYQVATSIEDAPYANPNKATLRVAPERKKIDVDVLSATYVELAKSLETRRMALAQETPLIQIVESPQYPLETIRPSAIKIGFIAAILFAILTIIVLVIVKWYRNVLQSN